MYNVVQLGHSPGIPTVLLIVKYSYDPHTGTAAHLQIMIFFSIIWPVPKWLFLLCCWTNCMEPIYRPCEECVISGDNKITAQHLSFNTIL